VAHEQEGREEDSLRERVDALPAGPGVYLFRDDEGNVLYVGKAASLRNRVRSYFQASRHLDSRTLVMVDQIASVEGILTDSETEALMLESNLIKEHRPRYNIRLRDDKHYPYIRVTMRDDYPRAAVARRVEHREDRYFGPFTDAGAVRETLRTLRSVFPYRTCSDRRLKRGGRPCLHFDTGRCMGPCRDEMDHRQYRDMIEELCSFLAGRREEVIRRLESRMHEAAEDLRFEEAARLRDKVRALNAIVERQKMVSTRQQDVDILGLARRDDDACLQLFFMRDGKIVGRERFFLQNCEGRDNPEVMGAFLKQYYGGNASIPPEILVSDDPPEAQALEGWLTDLRGSRAAVHRPRRGEKRRLVEMVVRNAALALDMEGHRHEEDRALVGEGLVDLAGRLGVSPPPHRIECYDISNIQGVLPVGSMVVFEHGYPARQAYRRFRLRTVTGPDDYAMMQEVIYRRFKRLRARADEDAGSPEVDSEPPGKSMTGFDDLPDLVLVDGGKGQVSAAAEVLEALGFDRLPLYGLAKKEEQLFASGEKQPIVLPRGSAALRLLQRVRDEAHRFALAYHRQLREKAAIRSTLDDIPGIGPKRRSALLQRFGSLEAIAAATLDQLAGVPGMNRRAANAVHQFFQD